ncbi:MAG: DUF11 domain-containing protein, partial [Sulfurovum sp.]|nr:DUF11 domain-containing protein [Sulfurovum sp.]
GMGDTITYTIEVANSSTVVAPASDIFVIDTLPSGASYVANLTGTGWINTASTSPLRFEYDQNLSANSSTSFSFDVTLPNFTGVVRNSAEANTSTIETSTPNISHWDTNITGAVLEFASTPTQNDPVGAYGSHEYNVTIINRGHSTANDINVTLTYNDSTATTGWSGVSGSGTGWSCGTYDTSNNTILCQLSTLGGSSTTSSVLTISSTAPNYNAAITNSIEVVGLDVANIPTGQTLSLVTTIVGSDISITKSAMDPNHPSPAYHDDNISVGTNQPIRFKISVSNNNLGLAKDVFVEDEFDSSFTGLSITSFGDWDSCSFVGHTLTCQRAELAHNATADDIIISASSPVSIGDYENEADVNTTTVETDDGNHDDEVDIKVEGLILNATLDVSKTEVALSEVFTYELNITNTSGNTAIDINITDILNADFTYIDNNGSSANWTCADTSNTITCTQPDISAYGGSTLLRLNVRAPADTIGTYTNSITIDSIYLDDPINVDAPDVRVVGADLLVSISAAPLIVLEDRNVTYVINIRDINISTAQPVTMVQRFNETIAALYITDDGGGACTIDAGNQYLNCLFKHIAFNQDKNITVVATMPSGVTIDPLTSTVEVNTTTPEESLSNNTATADVRVVRIVPVVDYRFDECIWDGTSGEVVDSRSSLNGTSYNGARTTNTISARDSSGFAPIWRVGEFDGSNDYIAIPDSPLINTASHNKRSISLWFKSTNTSTSNQVIYEEGGGTNGLAIYVRNDNLYIGGWNESTNWDSATYLSTAITPNQWHHVVLTLDTEKDNPNIQSNAFKGYLDGLEFASGDGSQLSSHSDNIAIGSVRGATNLDSGTNEDYQGFIDEVKIFNIALDDRAVSDIYTFEWDGKNYDGTTRNPVHCGVDLEVIKTASPSGDVGAESNITYTIEVSNILGDPIYGGFVLTDTLPDGVDYVSDSYSSNFSSSIIVDRNITWTFPNTSILASSETITIEVETHNVDKVDITNTATATLSNPTSEPDLDLSNNVDTAINRIIGTDLKITKTATPSFPIPGANFIYTVRVENISTLADARDIVMADKLDSNLTYHGIFPTTNESGSTIGCGLPDVNNTIYCSISNLSMGNFAEFNITVQSPTHQLGLLNEANVTSITVDTDLTNNSTSLTIDTNDSASGIHIDIVSEKNFRNDVSVNKYGNIAVIGNTMLRAVNLTPTSKLGDINSTQVNTIGSGYTNSSDATLDIITPTSGDIEDNITIEYARLFWGGYVKGSDKNETGFDVNFGEIKFITPDGAVHTISADKNDTILNSTAQNRVGYLHFKKNDENNRTADMSPFRIFYGASADITSIIRGLDPVNDLEGTYSVADLQVTSGIDTYEWSPAGGGNWKTKRYGHFGGWSMVVAYSVSHRHHRPVKFKNLSSFSGFKALLPTGPDGSFTTVDLSVPVTDFITPLHGDIDSSLFIFTQGGDRNLSLERMTVQDIGGNENNIREGLSNINNIFNSTITLRDFDGSNITKVPGLNYNVGTDIDQFNLDSSYDLMGNCINIPCYLSNRQNSTTIKVYASKSDIEEGIEFPSEKAFVQMLSMETQIFTPDFIDSYKECFKLEDPLTPDGGWVNCSEPLPLLRRGDTIKYRITALNTGDDYAKDVFIVDNLPEEVDYIPNGTIVDGVERNATVVTYMRPLTGSCINPLYDYNVTLRDACVIELNNDVNGTLIAPFVLDPSDINSSYDTSIGAVYDGSGVLSFDFPRFEKDHVVWIEFEVEVNNNSTFGESFENQFSIEFTNPTLEEFGLVDSQVVQVSVPVDSGIVSFNWDNIEILVRDIGRNSVGAKVVNEKFDLNITLEDMSAANVDDNITVRLNSLRIIDKFNDINASIYGSVNDANITLLDVNNINWFTNDTNWSRASKELGFDMNISIHNTDNNYTTSRIYPQDFNASLPYAGDVFTTRPALFDITLTGGITGTRLGVYYEIVSAGSDDLDMTINAPDLLGINSDEYNASLTQGAGIDIGLDNNFSITTGAYCIELTELNITDANFTNGSTNVNDFGYNEVGVIEIILQDSTWTALDSAVSDCNTSSMGDNNSSDADGLISCNVDGNSSSIVFRPDHFAFTGTTINNHNNFTYMVENPTIDPMFVTVETTVESRNAKNNITTLFTNDCFSDDVNITLDYNAKSKDFARLEISAASEQNNTADITVDTNITAIDSILAKAFGSN